MRSTIADSSFYICFLDDIKRPDFLKRMINSFEFLIGKIIKGEVEKSKNYFHIKQIFETKVILFQYENYGELLKPFFSLHEIKKGEHEVIAIAIIMSNFKQIIVIIDELDVRRFIQANFPELIMDMVGTVGFIKMCCCEYKIFSKEEAKGILNLIKNSRFRIGNNIIGEIIKDINGC